MKKIKIIIFLILFLAVFRLVPTLGRYVRNEIKDYYLGSKNFYFNSDKLEPNGIVYQVENWSGVDSYDVIFNMNSYKNNSIYAEADIYYDIEYRCSSNVSCSITKNSGVIYSDKHTDSFTVTILPLTPLEDGEKAWIEVTTTSTAPYVKILKGKFNVVVGKMGLSYEINDVPNRPYFEVAVTNTLDYYTVRTAFNGHSVGEKIDINTYLSFSEEEKANCASSIVTIDFNPRTTLLDMTASAYLKAVSTRKETIENYEYINNLSFKVDALSSNKVKFYKVDSTKDYTYPFGTLESIVDVSFD